MNPSHILPPFPRRPVALTVLAPFFLIGCMTVQAEQAVRMQDGKPVYVTTCNVDQSVLGNKAVIGKNRGQVITPENYCQKVAATCPNGVKVIDLQQGPPEFQVARMDSGTQRITRRFYTRKTTTTYQCLG